MTKRKSADEIGNTIRKKRQAFGAAKDRETKAKSKHNETESCFAKLPREVRRLIWTYVLGNEVLHARSSSKSLDVCGDARPSQLYRLSKTPENEAIPLSELAEKYVEAYNPDGTRNTPKGRGDIRYYRWSAFSHRSCEEYHLFNLATAQTEPNSWGENLAILRTCRMIYHEANNVLWTTNTLSFTEPDDFSTFMKHRTALQMQLITKLHIVLRDCDFGTVSQWQAKASHTVIKKLRGLKEVHFCFSQFVLKDCKKSGISWDVEYFKGQLAEFSGVFRICAPLRVATVIVENSYYCSARARLSHTQCLEWAEEFRYRLLDPEGPAKWQADRDAELAATAKRRDRERERQRIKFERYMCPMDSAEDCALRKQERQDARDERDGRNRKEPFVAQPCGYMHRNDFERDDSAETTAI